MTSRQQRRAAERTARKQSVRSGSIAPSTATHHHYSAASSAPSQPLHHDYSEVIAATTAAILYPGEDLDRYRNHLLHFFQQHTPAPGLESVVVKRLADFQWRLERIASLEAALMALGRHRFAELFADADPALRTALTDAHTLVVDGIPLKRLHLQESRLRRYYAGDLAELAALKESASSPSYPTIQATSTAKRTPPPAM